jgi:tetratricopeptide (TPR) repeat protein
VIPQVENVGVVAERQDAHDGPAKRRRWILQIAAAIFVPVMVLVIVEAGLRLAGVGFSTSLLVPCTVKGSPASCYNLFFATPYFPAGMVQTPRLYSIPATKPQGTYRIFVLGESAAMGDPDSAYGFSRYLEVMLRERFPSMKFEVVNTGSVAINSHVVLRIAEGLADQKPDLFIIYSGNNEVVGPYGPGTMLTSGGMSMPVVRSSIFFGSSRIGQLLTSLGTKKREWHGMEMFLDQQVPADSPRIQQAYSNYEKNLRDTIKVAQVAGAKVVVSTVATNLKDCAPFASLHRKNLSQDDLKKWSALVQQGNDLDVSNSPAEALKQYQAAAAIDERYAELEFRMARAAWRLRDYKTAREHFLRARDLDTLRFRADSKINDINRSVAASARVTLVDAEKILSDAAPDGIIGTDLIYEHVHMTPEGNYLLARAIFTQIAPALPQGTQASEPLSEAECERLLAVTGFDRWRLANEMFGRLQKPPFTNQLNHSEQLFHFAWGAEPPNENPNDTVTQYQWAIAQHPDDPMLHLRFGGFLFPYNRSVAAEQMGMAQPWDGYPMFLPEGTQIR